MLGNSRSIRFGRKSASHRHRPQTAPVSRPASLAGEAVSPEFALLAACVRWPDDAARHAAVRLAATGVDWHYVVALGGRHRVSALICHGLTRAGVTPPSPHAEALRAANQASAWNEFLLATELHRVLAALAGIGIEPVVLKGVAVAMAAYGRLGLRFSRDIDLLVRPGEVGAAAAMLTERGYVRIEPKSDASPREVRQWMRRRKDIVYHHTGSGFVIELHWRLFDNAHLMGDVHGAGTVPLASQGGEIRVLPADFALLYLCVHGAQHAWSRLKWLADVCALFSRQSIAEREAFYLHARARGIGRPVAQAMLLCERLCALPLPPGVAADSVADPWIARLARIALRAMAGGGTIELEMRRFGSTAKNLSHYLLYASLRYRLAEAWFDLADLSGTDEPSSIRRWGVLARPFAWIQRRRQESW